MKNQTGPFTQKVLRASSALAYSIFVLEDLCQSAKKDLNRDDLFSMEGIICIHRHIHRLWQLEEELLRLTEAHM